MIIRKANKDDINAIDNLLNQVLMVHHNGRPDLFKSNTKKYTDNELIKIINNKNTPVFVAEDEKKDIVGYAFCVIKKQINHNILTDIKTLYIDDLCVDENIRGKQIGKKLYEFTKAYAKDIGCYNLTLNVWACNENALKFYEKMGLVPQKIGMEAIL